MGKSIEDIFVRKRNGKRLPISRVVRISGDCVHRYFWWHWTKWKEQKQRAFQLLRIISSYQKTARRVFSYPVVLRTPCISYSPWSASFGFVCFIWIDWVGLSRAKWTRPKKPKNRSVSYSSFGRFSSRLCAVPPLGSECVLCVYVCVCACVWIGLLNFVSEFRSVWQHPINLSGQLYLLFVTVWMFYYGGNCFSWFLFRKLHAQYFLISSMVFSYIFCSTSCVLTFPWFRLMLLRLRFVSSVRTIWNCFVIFYFFLGALPLYVFSVYLHRIMHLKLHWLMSTDCVKHLFLVISSMHRR